MKGSAKYTDDAPAIEFARWSLNDSRLRDEILGLPMRTIVTPIRLAFAHRMRMAIVGMKVLKSTPAEIESIWKDARKRLREEKGIVIEVPDELKKARKYYQKSPTSFGGKRKDKERAKMEMQP